MPTNPPPSVAVTRPADQLAVREPMSASTSPPARPLLAWTATVDQLALTLPVTLPTSPPTRLLPATRPVVQTRVTDPATLAARMPAF